MPQLKILARGVDWLCVDKPAGLLVHRTALAHYERDTVVRRLTQQLGQKVFPVHRLDRPTSGCLVLGLTSDGARKAQEALQRSRKSYLALVRGEVVVPDGTVVDRPLKPEGGGAVQTASTEVHVLGTSKEPRCSLVLASPTTGRYHQIRRHLRGLNHPVLMDSTHGDTRCNATWRPRGLARLALHCAHIAWVHEDGNQALTAPLPEDLGVFRTLPFYADAVARGPAWLSSL